MNEVNLGKLITGQAFRDAVHIAVLPVEAGGMVFPGDNVGLDENGKAVRCSDPIGIVDPFLPGNCLKKGDKFYLCLYPGTITSLRHVWTHPALMAKVPGKEKNL